MAAPRNKRAEVQWRAMVARRTRRLRGADGSDVGGGVGVAGGVGGAAAAGVSGEGGGRRLLVVDAARTADCEWVCRRVRVQQRDTGGVVGGGGLRLGGAARLGMAVVCEERFRISFFGQRDYEEAEVARARRGR